MSRQSLRPVKFLCLLGVLGLSVPLRGAVESPIADAAMHRDKAALQTLLRQGSDVNAPQGDGMTALHWAAATGDADVAALLVNARAAVNPATRISAETPLHVAGRLGAAAVIDVLLRAGADANAATTTGATPLMFAAGAGDAASVKLLLAHGAKVNLKEAAKGHTALMFAAAADRAPVIKLLLESGADANATTTVFDLSEVQIAPDRTAQNNASSVGQRAAQQDRTPQVAGRERRYEQNELVAAQGGLTALHFAARQGHVEAVKAFLDGGVDINQVTAGVGASTLLLAIINGHFDLAMYLLEKGANPNLTEENGVAALYAAVNLRWIDEAEHPQPRAYLQQKTSYLQLMQALLDKGADPNIRVTKKVWYSGYGRDNSGVDEMGSTAFWRAAYSSDVEGMRLLLAHGADPNIRTVTVGRPQPAANGLPGVPSGGPNSTPLHAAAGDGTLQSFAQLNGHRTHPAGWLPAVKYLVEEVGLDVNARDANGNTPLHYAAARGDNEMIQYLVSKGADVTLVNRRGQTTADAANGPLQRVQPFPETVKLLESLGAKNNHKCVSC